MPSLQVETWLTEALEARHLLRTGAAMASVSYGGRTVSYSQANAGELDSYIAELQKQLDPSRGRRTFRVTQTDRGL